MSLARLEEGEHAYAHSNRMFSSALEEPTACRLCAATTASALCDPPGNDHPRPAGSRRRCSVVRSSVDPGRSSPDSHLHLDRDDERRLVGGNQLDRGSCMHRSRWSRQRVGPRLPPVDTTEDVFYDSGSEGGGGGAVPASEFDSMTFQDRYTIVPDGGPSSITMTPTAATPCGASTTIALCQSGSAASFIGTDLVMGESEEFSALTGTDGIVLLGSLSGPGPLLANVTAGSGSVVLTGADSYTGGTILGSGLLAGDSPSAFGNPAGAVTADNGGTVQICAPITVDYSLHLGDSAALMAGCGTATWSGPITVDSGGAEILNAGSTSTLTVSGNISGSDPLAIQTFASVESSILSGDNSTYSGTITVESGATLASEPAVAGNTPLGTGAVVVDAGGTLEGTGPVPSVDHAGTFAPGTTTTPGLFTSSGSDNLGPGTIDVAITGPTAGSGYAQFANSTSEVDVDGATLAVDDTYAAPYGTVFHVVSLSGSASEAGALRGRPLGDGHQLERASSQDRLFTDDRRDTDRCDRSSLPAIPFAIGQLRLPAGGF